VYQVGINKGTHSLSPSPFISETQWNNNFHRCIVHVASIISLIYQLMHTVFTLQKALKFTLKTLKTCPYMFRSMTRLHWVRNTRHTHRWNKWHTATNRTTL